MDPLDQCIYDRNPRGGSKQITLGGLNRSPTPSCLEKVPNEGTASMYEQGIE